jgi:UDP-N-acetylmuramoyl-tripeptide--D-alanyl-D-alanine ligase
MKLSDLLSSDFLIKQKIEDKTITGVSIDSRDIKPGNLFVAIIGKNLDGHDYIASALKNGAAAIVASKKTDVNAPLIIVHNTEIALQQMAMKYRQSWLSQVVAITGSCGKTTTKNLLGSILKTYQPTLCTSGNFNNLFGLPLTMLRFEHEHKFGVFEVGASYIGEIQQLAKILKPNIALITNAGASHLENMGGSINAIAKEKGSLISSLSCDGVAIINIDDDNAKYWTNLADNRKWYGFSMGSNDYKNENCQGVVYARKVSINNQGSEFDVEFNDENLSIRLNIPGAHNVENALGAIAVAKALNIPNEFIVKGLANATSEKGRLNLFGTKDRVIIDDSYNANPKSFIAAIDVISDYQQRKIVIMGDMGELSDLGKKYHHEIGEYAASKGIDMLLCHGDLSKYSVESFGTNARSFSTKEQLLEVLPNILGEEWVILVKGSRSMGMEFFTNHLKSIV